MKVLNKSGGSSQRVLRSGGAAPAEAVEGPPRLNKRGSKKKPKEGDPLNVTLEDSDREDPLPKKARKEPKDSEKSKSRKPVIEDEDESDGEAPKAGPSKRKARVLSDSDEDDLKPSKEDSTVSFPPAVEKTGAKKQSNKGGASLQTKRTESKKTPVKPEQTFKVPCPVTKEKSKPQTVAPVKRSVPEDDEDEVYNPKKRSAAASKGKPLPKMSLKPKNLGSKDIPVGAPDCLKDQAFVISGVLDSLTRDDCKELVVKYGGRVTVTVSGKTNYLIIGDGPGESSIKKAKQLNVPQIREEDLLEMIRKSNPNRTSQDSGLDYSEDMVVDSEQMKSDSEYDPDIPFFETPKKKKDTNPKKKKKDVCPKKQESTNQAKKESLRKVKEEVDKKVPAKGETKSSVPSSSTAAAAACPVVIPSALDLMWVDKYKPKTLKDVVGQGLDWNSAKKLVRWLQNWFQHHGTSPRGKVKASWQSKQGNPSWRDPEGKTFKAALLSGPPGIGKTTTAHLAVKEVGYDYFELNASNTRNKKGLHEKAADALSSKSLVFGKDEELARKHVLIMDEVDGISGNEDRGGVQELIALIKTSRVPLICICNDRNHTKIRSLANYCYDLRFYKPSVQQLKAFVSKICFAEKMKIPQERVQQLILSTDNDVRQILHQLEFYKEGKSDQAFDPRKDLKFGPWDIVQKVLNRNGTKCLSMRRIDYFSKTIVLVPCLYKKITLNASLLLLRIHHKHMVLLGKTAGSIADADLVDTVIRRSQNWDLLPVQGAFASYIPGVYMESNSMGKLQFPQWLGKNSTTNKNHRNLQSLHTHLHLHISGSLEALNMDYLPYLSKAIIKPLAAGDYYKAAEVMQQFTLHRDDFDSITNLSKWPGKQEENVSRGYKAAFSRLVNKEILPYSKPAKGKWRGGGGVQEGGELLLAEGEGAPVEEEEEDESVEKDAMVKLGEASSKAKRKKGKMGKMKIEIEYSDDSDDYE